MINRMKIVWNQIKLAWISGKLKAIRWFLAKK